MKNDRFLCERARARRIILLGLSLLMHVRARVGMPGGGGEPVLSIICAKCVLHRRPMAFRKDFVGF